jgi:hypothetical protein
MASRKIKNVAASSGVSMPGGSDTFVPSLNDKKKQFSDQDYFQMREVSIFDAHHGSEEGIDVDFDKAKLQEIIDNCNRRISDTNDAVPIYDKHTSDDQEELPDLLGYATDFALGKIGNDNPRDTIVCTLNIKKEKWDKAKSLPRRSIELWKDMVIDPIVMSKDERKAIDCISLLGNERPARDLGLLAAKKIGYKSKYNYEFVNKEDKMIDEDMLREILEAVVKLPEIEYCKQMMEKEMVSGETHDFEEDMGGNENGGQMSKDKMDKMDDKQNPMNDEDTNPEDKKSEKYKLQRDQERRRFAKLEAHTKRLEDRFAELEKKELISSRKSDLLGLEGEGISFDMAEELDNVADMDVARYRKHINTMRVRYSRSPVGVKINVANPEDRNLSEDPHDVTKKAAAKAAEMYGKK